jgi:hypothetical protein
MIQKVSRQRRNAAAKRLLQHARSRAKRGGRRRGLPKGVAPGAGAELATEAPQGTHKPNRRREAPSNGALREAARTGGRRAFAAAFGVAPTLLLSPW